MMQVRGFSVVDGQIDPHRREADVASLDQVDVGLMLPCLVDDDTTATCLQQPRSSADATGRTRADKGHGRAHFRGVATGAVQIELSRAEGMVAAFEHLQRGAIVLDASARIIQLNQMARAFVGNGIAIAGGRLLSTSAPANTALQKLIAGAVGRDCERANQLRSHLPLPRQASRPLIACVSPITNLPTHFQLSKAIVTLVDPERRLPRSEVMLVRLFNLTQAEARLAARIGSGDSLQSAASELRITHETARTVLKRVFSKAGVSRQSQLAVLLSRLPL